LLTRGSVQRPDEFLLVHAEVQQDARIPEDQVEAVLVIGLDQESVDIAARTRPVTAAARGSGRIGSRSRSRSRPSVEPGRCRR
jgi:hypothetical protein